MAYRIRDLVKDWRADDAEKLTLTENEATVAWPGGGGWQVTPQEVERFFRDTDHIGIYVTEEGKRIVSICSLLCNPGQKEDSYIPHLNCLPDYHGKGYGKAVLLAAVEGAYRNGFRKVDLNTWAANMKAVPLYKRPVSCGSRTRRCSWKTSRRRRDDILWAPASSNGTAGMTLSSAPSI